MTIPVLPSHLHADIPDEVIRIEEFGTVIESLFNRLESQNKRHQMLQIKTVSYWVHFRFSIEKSLELNVWFFIQKFRVKFSNW